MQSDPKRKAPSMDDPAQDTTDAPPSKRPASINSNRDNSLSPERPNPTAIETPPKRKRGRPPGSKTKPAQGTTDTPPSIGPYPVGLNGDNSSNPEHVDPIAIETPPKKKRGRPPGSKTKPTQDIKDAPSSAGPRSLELNEDNSTITQHPDPVSTETPLKRKRGRPLGSKTKPALKINGFVSPPITNGFGNHKLPVRNSSSRPEPAFTNGDDTEDGEDEGQFEELDISPAVQRELAALALKRVFAEDISEDEDLLEEENRFRGLLVDALNDSQTNGVANDEENVSLIPSTQPTTKRGRPKGSRRKRTPTPPIRELPPHERYFYQNRPGAVKTSTNTLSSIKLLDHDEYFEIMNNLKDPHLSERQYLEELHSRSFPQWRFELHEGFNICLYGWGSKRSLVNKYATWLHSTLTSDGLDPSRRIIIINGYVSTLTTRDILSTINTTLHPHTAPDAPTDLNTTLSQIPETQPPLTLLINSIDSPSLRRPAAQSLLATLSAHPSINVLATADVPNFPLLWDSTLRETFNFLFHDCTTFAPFSAEIDVVESVHDLLGRSGRRIGGREGVAFVLRSLPENARNLYRVLVGEQLAVLDEGLENVADGEGADGAIEYRVLYQKAVEEFICSSEMAFRTLLKEFHDHQMVKSRKDSLGTEVLWVPFRREELEAILEDLII